MEERTSALYKEIAQDIIHSVVRGFNGTIFAYGQTTSGKTYTMTGTESEPGLIPLAIDEVFGLIRRTADRDFFLRVSYLEIYNEQVNCLLGPDDATSRGLIIREDPETGVFVEGAQERAVSTEAEIVAALREGNARRHIRATTFNDFSSRSHAIFQVCIESRPRQTGAAGEEDAGSSVRVSVLNLVDLAGSEKLWSMEDASLKETTAINKSLFTLGKVILRLSEGNNMHIPYREGKLTRILEPALGGNSITLIVCTAAPCAGCCEETISTLKFASRAKKVTNRAQINEFFDVNAQLSLYKRELAELREQLLQLEAARNERERDSSTVAELRRRLEQETDMKRLLEEKVTHLQSLLATRTGGEAADGGAPFMLSAPAALARPAGDSSPNRFGFWSRRPSLLRVGSEAPGRGRAAARVEEETGDAPAGRGRGEDENAAVFRAFSGRQGAQEGDLAPTTDPDARRPDDESASLRAIPAPPPPAPELDELRERLVEAEARARAAEARAAAAEVRATSLELRVAGQGLPEAERARAAEERMAAAEGRAAALEALLDGAREELDEARAELLAERTARRAADARAAGLEGRARSAEAELEEARRELAAARIRIRVDEREQEIALRRAALQAAGVSLDDAARPDPARTSAAGAEGRAGGAGRAGEEGGAEEAGEGSGSEAGESSSWSPGGTVGGETWRKEVAPLQNLIFDIQQRMNETREYLRYLSSTSQPSRPSGAVSETAPAPPGPPAAHPPHA